MMGCMVPSPASPSTAEAADDAPLTERPLTGLLFLVAKSFRNAIGERIRNEEWLIQVGFRPPCIGALMVLSAREPMSQRELSAHLAVDPSDLVGVMDILESAGFVSRQRDPADRRRHLLNVTPEGHEAVKRLRKVMSEVDDEILTPLTANQREQLHNLLAKVVAHRLDAAADA
jgi:MarR family transcriptional regulator, lower aerobic nicotinate degradation pathway regulator